MQKDVFAELVLRLGNIMDTENDNINLILMEDVRNYIIENAPSELGIDYKIDIYRNSIRARLFSDENILMNLNCEIQHQEGRNNHGYQETDFYIVINVTAIIEDYSVTRQFKIDMITQGKT